MSEDNDSPYSEEELEALRKAKSEFEERYPKHLQPLFHNSVVKETARGIRRYFPLASRDIQGWGYLHEAFYIIYGRQPKDDAEVCIALLNDNLEHYIEEFNGKLWVRTICIY